MNNDLQIVVWNVEHGSAVYARMPNGLSIVMDAGASTTFSPASWLKTRRGVQQAHLFVLSHADTDHLRDIEQVDQLLSPCVFLRNRTSPRDLIYPTYPPTTNPLKYFHDFDARYSVDLATDSPYRLSPISNWGGVTIQTFFNSSSEYTFAKLNDYSVAVFLLYGNLEFLFPGDLEAPGWEALMKNERFCALSRPSSSNKEEVRILVAAHHGRAAGVHKPFLELYQPHLVLMSDKYGSEFTDYSSYYIAAEGYIVYDSQAKTSNTRYVLSTKVNDYILVKADPASVSVIV